MEDQAPLLVIDSHNAVFNAFGSASQDGFHRFDGGDHLPICSQFVVI